MKIKTLLMGIVILCTGLIRAEMNVVTSTSDLGWFAREIGGDMVVVSSIASPTSDIHFIEVRPSYMAKIARADIVFKVGLDLGKWMDQLIDGSRNGKLSVIDCSKYIKPLEVPTFKADARYGDIHPHGNPHYWIGPQNVEAIVTAIREGLQTADPKNAGVFQANADSLLSTIASVVSALQPELQKLKGKKVIYYHDSWPYFNEFTGLVAAGFVEPYPGVPPTPSHMKEIIELIKSDGIGVIAIEPYFDERIPRKIAAESGANIITLYPSIGGRNKNESYGEWLKGNVEALIEGMR